jgi:pyrroloquinoline quinone biosynthesis protein B
MAARAADDARTQDCLAISGDGTAWYLVNASPDIRTQILATPELTPGPERRQTPLRGVLFSSAELDHTLGLVALREATALAVFGTPTVLDALPFRELVRPYGGFTWNPLDGPVLLDGGIEAVGVPIGSKRPRYAAGQPEAPDWVIAYRFTDRRTGGVLVYAPCLAEWTSQIAGAVGGASAVLLDGSFFTDDEMARRTGSGPTARQMGHLPIADSLVRRSGHPDTRWLYTHLNNTNPVLAPDGPEYAAVLASYAEIATDDLLLTL